MAGPPQQSFTDVQPIQPAQTFTNVTPIASAQPPKDQFTQDRELTEAWAQDHPILGPIARFLVSGGQHAANAITDTPGALYHAIVDPPKDEKEAVLSPEQRVIYRLGGKEAIEAGEDYAAGKVTPKGALSVLPDALGAGLGTTAGGAFYGKATELAPDVAGLTKGAIDTATPYVKPVAKFGGQALDVATFERVGKLYKAYQNMRASYAKPTYPGASLPETPPPELLQASALSKPSTTPAPEPAAALQQPLAEGEALKNRFQNLPQGSTPLDRLRNQEVPPAQPQYPAERPSIERLADYPTQPSAQPAPAAAPTTPTPGGAGMPRTMSGESALRQVLTGQDNAQLLKIAKSRGINVTREAQLKPGAANNLLVNKIVDDFSDDELQEVRAQFIENTRFRHLFGDVGPEAWKTMSMQTYFPDMKIPATQMARTAKAIQGSSVSQESPVPSTGEDLTPVLQEMLRRAQAAKARTQ